MSYSARIMNLPLDGVDSAPENSRAAYFSGHRDARHAAAEIAAEADQEIAEARRCVAEAMERERLAANDCADAQARLEVAQRMADALSACWELGIDSDLVPQVRAALAAWKEANK